MKFVIIIILFLFLPELLFCADSYPVSIEDTGQRENGRLVITGFDNKDINNRTFLLKPRWDGRTDFIYIRKNLLSDSSNGIYTDIDRLVAAEPYQNGLLMLFSKSSRYFVSELDSTGVTVSITEIFGITEQNNIPVGSWINPKEGKNRLLLIDTKLYYLSAGDNNSITVTSIADDVKNAAFLDDSNNGSTRFEYLVNKEGTGFLYYYDGFFSTIQARLPIQDEVRLFPCNKGIAVVLGSKYFPSSVIEIVEPKLGIISNIGIDSRIDLIKPFNSNEICFLSNRDEGYVLNISNYNDLSQPKNWRSADLPKDFIEPMGINVNENTINIVFRNGIVIIGNNAGIIAADYHRFGEVFTEMPSIQLLNEYLILESPDYSIILKEKTNHLWVVSRFFDKTGKYFLQFLLIVLLFFIIGLKRKQKRLLNTLMTLPSSGAVLVFDASGRLLQANSTGKRLFGTSDGVPMRKHYQYYCTHESTLPVRNVIEKGINNQSSFSQKIMLMAGGEEREWFCIITTMKNITGRFRGILFNGFDITEELGKNRLTNWAQLAHDMQTNLSTILLNAQMLEMQSDNGNIQRRSKIIYQTALLINRVRDLVTVGSNAAIDKFTIEAQDICRDVRNEFDETLFPHVKFIVDSGKFKLTCDKPKLIRALRNAVENGIRSFNGNPGTISISAWVENRFSYFCIKDTGIGMDAETKNRILTPYFTTNQNRGGTGIGTMIMQQVAELHGGELQINSVAGLGTEIIFKIPNNGNSR